LPIGFAGQTYASLMKNNNSLRPAMENNNDKPVTLTPDNKVTMRFNQPVAPASNLTASPTVAIAHKPLNDFKVQIVEVDGTNN
jgi:hypothetical protein